jgi:hypothetical protein
MVDIEKQCEKPVKKHYLQTSSKMYVNFSKKSILGKAFAIYNAFMRIKINKNIKHDPFIFSYPIYYFL